MALIVSRDQNDASVVQSCFQLCRVEAAVCNRLDPRGDFRCTTTVVVFPDDFSAQAAALSVPRLSRRFSHASVIVVTLDVTFFETIARKLNNDSARRVFVLPRPLWGWALLDRMLSSRQSKATTSGTCDASPGE